ncbi:Ldh family oxidoreductase [Planomonospora venezuelensis]|uniref:Ureidoglycolate dehydrogenase (NAD+) n=1 Tax=Planomonospora venezuelensis TaxID=1999 RepID=A0A841D9U2_PLAVE|nr:Ldh family oxidoreductase [Planomonospora venezuelensis]MBB5967392.1 ureidoglycolate dehydrogenase (NAD+) [Planomonospora venezuelensis]GIN05310.1 dehydrogenase [Planomonospora venezuelensis]
MPPAAKVVIPADELTAFVTDLFTRSGTSPDHARTISDVLIWASLRGVDSHGVSRVPRYLELLGSGEANAAPDIRTASGASGVAVIDADRAPGPVALTAAAAEAGVRARSCGIGAVAVRRTVHTGAIGYYTSKIAEEGLIGIGFVAGMPNMSYTGAKGAAVATSPLAIAVPAAGRPPVLLDMATATIALGKIAQYRNSGQPLPEGAAATADGVPTTDPNLAKMPLPMGGAKGAGMSLVFELITSVLVQAPILASFHSNDPEGRVHRQNALIIAIDPAAFGAGDEFAAAVGTTVETLKGLPRADGVDEIFYPGERSAGTAVARAADGIPVGPKVWKELVAAADGLGVKVPGPVTAPGHS